MKEWKDVLPITSGLKTLKDFLELKGQEVIAYRHRPYINIAEFENASENHMVVEDMRAKLFTYLSVNKQTNEGCELTMKSLANLLELVKEKLHD